MKSTVSRIALGIALAGGLSISAVRAEDGVKTLPTLLIKGEVVSLDANDPSATLLKVKDRYGFETPIFITPETKVSKGATTENITSLTAGTPVEVEYNFDVNTAKRHAVSVKITTPAPAAAEAAPAAAPSIPTTVQAPAPAAGSTPPAAPATPEAPVTSTPPPQGGGSAPKP